MRIDFLLSVFGECAADEAIIWKEKSRSYAWLLDAVARQQAALEEHDIGGGQLLQ